MAEDVSIALSNLCHGDDGVAAITWPKKLESGKFKVSVLLRPRSTVIRAQLSRQSTEWLDALAVKVEAMEKIGIECALTAIPGPAKRN